MRDKRTKDKENEGQRGRGIKRTWDKEGIDLEDYSVTNGPGWSKRINESSRIDWLEEVGRGAQQPVNRGETSRGCC